MSTHQTSSKGSFTVGKLAGTMVAAGALLFAAPAAVAFADPLGDTVNNVNNIVRGNVEGTNNIVRGNVFGGNGSSRATCSAEPDPPGQREQHKPHPEGAVRLH